MNTQPESLRLAHVADHPIPPDWIDMVAAVRELLRLHAENEALQQVYDARQLEIDHLRGATKMMDPAGEYPPLPRPFIFAHESGGVEWPDTFDATQMRTYADATCAMRAQAAHAAVAGQCEDAIELLGKYKELCEEIKRGDSYHIGRIDAAISVLAQAAPQPAVQQGAPVAWRSWDSENSRWNFTLWPDEWAGHADVWEPLYTYPAAPVAQGDAQQRAMDARHAAIYRWIIQHIDKAASIIDAWREDGEADKDELHDALAARAAKEGARHG